MAKKREWFKEPPKHVGLNYADDAEKAEVRAILSDLPPNHQAVVAWADGRGCDHITLMHLVAQHSGMAQRIMDAKSRGDDRLSARSRRDRPTREGNAWDMKPAKKG